MAIGTPAAANAANMEPTSLNSLSVWPVPGLTASVAVITRAEAKFSQLPFHRVKSLPTCAEHSRQTMAFKNQICWEAQICAHRSKIATDGLADAMNAVRSAGSVRARFIGASGGGAGGARWSQERQKSEMRRTVFTPKYPLLSSRCFKHNYMECQRRYQSFNPIYLRYNVSCTEYQVPYCTWYKYPYQVVVYIYA